MKNTIQPSPDQDDFFSFDDLPDGWECKKLGKIVSPSKEKIEPTADSTLPYIGLEHIESNSSKIIGQRISGDAKSTKTVFHSGDVLYGKLRPYLNKVAIPDFDGVCSTDILVFNQNQIIDSRYLMRYLSTREVVEYANLKSKGISLPRVNFESLAAIPVPLPPFAEQQRIVARVEVLLAHVNAARDRLSRVPLIMKRFRQTVLQFAIEGRLVQLDSSEKISITDDIHSSLPSGWKLDAIENQVSRLTNGYVGPTRDIYIDKGIPYLLARHIKKHKIVFDQRTFISEEFNQKNRKSILKKGDVLLVQSGDIGQTAVVGDAHIGHNCHALIVITPKEESLDGRFLSIYFSSITGQEMTRQIQTGITLKHLNCKDVKKIKIPLPPIAEQHEIVRRVNTLFERADAVEREVAAATKRTEALTQAVLGKAFRGELMEKMEPGHEIK